MASIQAHPLEPVNRLARNASHGGDGLPGAFVEKPTLDITHTPNPSSKPLSTSPAIMDQDYQGLRFWYDGVHTPGFNIPDSALLLGGAPPAIGIPPRCLL